MIVPELFTTTWFVKRPATVALSPKFGREARCVESPLKYSTNPSPLRTLPRPFGNTPTRSGVLTLAVAVPLARLSRVRRVVVIATGGPEFQEKIPETFQPSTTRWTKLGALASSNRLGPNGRSHPPCALTTCVRWNSNRPFCKSRFRGSRSEVVVSLVPLTFPAAELPMDLDQV